LSDDNAKSTKKGSLIIVGSGIQAIRQFTLESRQETAAAAVVSTRIDTIGTAATSQMTDRKC
jgi:hypothetical protein